MERRTVLICKAGLHLSSPMGREGGREGGRERERGKDERDHKWTKPTSLYNTYLSIYLSRFCQVCRYSGGKFLS